MFRFYAVAELMKARSPGTTAAVIENVAPDMFLLIRIWGIIAVRSKVLNAATLLRFLDAGPFNLSFLAVTRDFCFPCYFLGA